MLEVKFSFFCKIYPKLRNIFKFIKVFHADAAAGAAKIVVATACRATKPNALANEPPVHISFTS